VAGANATAPQSVQVFDGRAWTTLGTVAAVIPGRTYVPLSVEADAGSATLTVNGQSFRTTVRSGPATTYDGLTFTTGDAPEYGGAFYLDEVTVPA
jgi:hypothetical protein